MDRKNEKSIASALGFSETEREKILFMVTEKFAGVKTTSEHIEKICGKRKLNIEDFWGGSYLYAFRSVYITKICERSQLTEIEQIAEELNISQKSQNKIKSLAKKSCSFEKISDAIKIFYGQGNFDKKAVLAGFYFTRMSLPIPALISQRIAVISSMPEYDPTDLADLNRIAG